MQPGIGKNGILIMAYLDHRCSRCNHVRLFHEHGRCMDLKCRCRDYAGNEEPELISTFTPLGKPATAITTPGAYVLYEQGTYNMRACACPRCTERHSQLTADRE